MNTQSKSKMALATAIYKKMIQKNGVQRKDIIAKFQSEAGLSKAGAGTYYNNIKKKLAENAK
jgi:hypothetical protein